MWLIAILLIIGVLMLVAEIVLLPGLSVAGILAFGSYGYAGYRAFQLYGVNGLIATIVVAAIISAIAIFFSLRAKTWQRFSLGSKIESVSQEDPQENNVKVGERGMTLTRLAPIGKVLIDGKVYEAKSSHEFIDQKSEVEVVDFENFNVVVKRVNF